MASNAQNYALLKMSLCITTYGSGGTWDGNAQKESSLSNLPKTSSWTKSRVKFLP